MAVFSSSMVHSLVWCLLILFVVIGVSSAWSCGISVSKRRVAVSSTVFVRPPSGRCVAVGFSVSLGPFFSYLYTFPQVFLPLIVQKSLQERDLAVLSADLYSFRAVLNLVSDCGFSGVCGCLAAVLRALRFASNSVFHQGGLGLVMWGLLGMAIEAASVRALLSDLALPCTFSE